MSAPSVIRIGVISDTHVPERAPDVPAQALKALQGSDIILHAGDIVDLKVLRTLKTVCSDVRAVWGNMDPETSHGKLSQKLVFKAGGLTIGMMHGWGPPGQLIPLLQREFAKDMPDIIVFGHSHQPTAETVKGTLFFNPGSATDTVFAPYPSVGIITITGGKPRAEFVKLDG